MIVTAAVAVERFFEWGQWVVRNIDGFGNPCGVSYYTKVKSDALLVEAQMREELHEIETQRSELRR